MQAPSTEQKQHLPADEAKIQVRRENREREREIDIRLLPQNRQDPNWEIRKTKNWPKSSGFPNLDPPNLQILEPPGSCRLQDFLILAAGFANFRTNLEGPKSGNNWVSAFRNAIRTQFGEDVYSLVVR